MTKLTVYTCSACGNRHQTVLGAQACCPRETWEVTAYVCDSCGLWHDTEELAKECEEYCKKSTECFDCRHYWEDTYTSGDGSRECALHKALNRGLCPHFADKSNRGQ